MCNYHWCLSINHVLAYSLCLTHQLRGCMYLWVATSYVCSIGLDMYVPNGPSITKHTWCVRHSVLGVLIVYDLRTILDQWIIQYLTIHLFSIKIWKNGQLLRKFSIGILNAQYVCIVLAIFGSANNLLIVFSLNR